MCLGTNLQRTLMLRITQVKLKSKKYSIFGVIINEIVLLGHSVNWMKERLLYLRLEHKKNRSQDVLTQKRTNEISTVLQTYSLNTIFVGLMFINPCVVIQCLGCAETHPRHQPTATLVNTTRYCTYTLVLQMMGENIARNMQS